MEQVFHQKIQTDWQPVFLFDQGFPVFAQLILFFYVQQVAAQSQLCSIPVRRRNKYMVRSN